MTVCVLGCRTHPGTFDLVILSAGLVVWLLVLFVLPQCWLDGLLWSGEDNGRGT